VQKAGQGIMIIKKSPEIFDVTVRRIKDFGNETRHYELSLEDGKSMDFMPGQFVSIIYPENGKVIRRAYSIASPPEEKKQIDLCLKLVPGGKVTPWFWTFHEGKRIQVHGPFGKFVLPFEVEEQELVFIATGTGIAPFRSMIRDLLHKGFQRNIWLLFGTRYERSIPYDEEWRLLESYYPQFHYIPTVSRPSAGWKGEIGYVQTKISKFFPQPDGKLVYICGLNQMIQAVQEECLKRGFQKEMIHHERFD